jgi:hypothetical protein
MLRDGYAPRVMDLAIDVRDACMVRTLLEFRFKIYRVPYVFDKNEEQRRFDRKELLDFLLPFFEEFPTLVSYILLDRLSDSEFP